MAKITILDIPVEQISFQQAVDLIIDHAQAGNHHIVTVNPEMIVEAQHNQTFRTALKQADLVVPDGTGILAAAKLLTQGPNPQNPIIFFLKELAVLFALVLNRKSFTGLSETISGVDLTVALAKRANNLHIPVVLIGGNTGEAAGAFERLQADNPSLTGQSLEGPPAVEHETAEQFTDLVKDQLKYGQALTFVAFGSPKQELWIAKHLTELPRGAVIGVGGTFTFLSGRKRRAPAFIRRFGFEWLWRLILQPWRIKRIFNAVIVFPCLIYQAQVTKAKTYE